MLYVNTQVMAIRRVLRAKSTGISWFTLLSQIAKRGPDLTVAAFLENALGQGVSELILQFERQWIEDSWFDNGRFRSELVMADHQRLATTAKNVLKLTDTSVAHLDPAKARTFDRPTFDDLSESIDRITDVQRRYVRLIRGVDIDPELVVEVEPRWSDVFSVPLFGESE